MSIGHLPPVPDLIPITALLQTVSIVTKRKSALGGAVQTGKIMDTQRSLRTHAQLSCGAIDNRKSRGVNAAPRLSQTQRRNRLVRRHKSVRQRERIKVIKTRSTVVRNCNSASENLSVTDQDEPINIPRVNPIFVWVRQEDNRIVEVKCEDYDKRNRIVLTKTAHGWRAIPKTETLLPNRTTSDDSGHKYRKSRKTKPVQKSVAVQIDDIIPTDELPNDETDSNASWTSSNTKLSVPSENHEKTYESSSKCSDLFVDNCVGNNIDAIAQTQIDNHNDTNVCQITNNNPLDNLLAVAEFELQQHIKNETWKKSRNASLEIDNAVSTDTCELPNLNVKTNDHINTILEESSSNFNHSEIPSLDNKDSNLSFNEDDDNSFELEASDIDEIKRSLLNSEYSNEALTDNELKNSVSKSPEITSSCATQIEIKSEPNYIDTMTNMAVLYTESSNNANNLPVLNSNNNNNSSNNNNSNNNNSVDFTSNFMYENPIDEDLFPTDLSIPKSSEQILRHSLRERPNSQNSDAIQSPQPSGIPAVAPSPDITTSTTTISSPKQKSTFLESLLSMNLMIRKTLSEKSNEKKEPVDSINSRNLPSPIVSSYSEGEHLNDSQNSVDKCDRGQVFAKKTKFNDITLKNLLDHEFNQKNRSEASASSLETPKLIELLKTDCDYIDPVLGLKQLMQIINIPDPMLIPKSKLSSIISNPAREIPKLLKDRPELRLPEALAIPQLLHDPNILLITLEQLQAIILKQKQSLNIDLKALMSNKEQDNVSDDKKAHNIPAIKLNGPNSNKRKIPDPIDRTEHVKQSKGKITKGCENDIDANTTAAFNQMVWLPYLNQLQTISSNNNNNKHSDERKSFSDQMIFSALPSTQPNNTLNEVSRYFEAKTNPCHLSTSSVNNRVEAWPISTSINKSLRPNITAQHQQKNQYASLQQEKDNSSGMVSTLLKRAQTEALNQHNFNALYSTNYFNNNSNNSVPELSAVNPFFSVPNIYARVNNRQYTPHASNQLRFPYPPNKSNGTQRMPSTTQFNTQMYGSLSAGANQHKQYRPNYYASQLEKHHDPAHLKIHSNNGFSNNNNNNNNNSCRYNLPSFHSRMKVANDRSSSSKYYQPIDLSGSNLCAPAHLFDSLSSTNCSKQNDEIPEVGSTTVSIEEMQAAQRHLWHPLFGNQKNHSSPFWSWKAVPMTNE